MMPSLFISHGAPDRVVSQSPAKQFLHCLQESLPAKPRAIIIFSAHWFSEAVLVTAAGALETIHDMWGFPEKLYQVRYPATTPQWLHQSVSHALNDQGVVFQSVERGLDHGAWSVLALAYPEANIPVIGISIPIYQDFQKYIEFGRVFRCLREEGYLVIGSGSATHNLRELSHSAEPPQWAKEYTLWLQKTVLANDYAALANPYQAHQLTRRAHPTPDHYIPLLIAAGAAINEPVKVLHDSFEYGSLNNTSFLFGADDAVSIND